MKLIPLSMRRPSKDFVQAPSEIRGEVEISNEQFGQIADTAKASLVSLEDDGVSNPQQITSYTLNEKVQLESGKTCFWPSRYIIKG